MIRFLLTLVLSPVECWGFNHSSPLLDQGGYGTWGDPDTYDIDYFGEHDEEYAGNPTPAEDYPEEVTSTTVKPTPTPTSTTLSTNPTTTETTHSGPPTRPLHQYPNGTLYDDYNCRGIMHLNYNSGAPKAGGGAPAPLIIVVCLALTAAHEMWRNSHNR